jgi:predicted DCC family thiol-disulfide oxidoreductase YuxK
MVDEATTTPQEISVVIPAQVQERAPRMIILFDGVCNVCHTFVSFIYPRDVEKRFYFQAMQSKKGREILASWGIPNNLNTVVLVDEANNKYYTKSTAIFNILKDLKVCYLSIIMHRIF